MSLQRPCPVSLVLTPFGMCWMQLSLLWSIDDSFINSQMSSVVYLQPSGRAAPGKGSNGRPEAHSESEDSDESDEEVSDDEDAPLPGEIDDDDSDVADEDAVDIDSEEEDLPEADDDDDDDAEESDEQEEQQIEESESDAEDVPSAQPQANGRSAVMADVDEEESSEGGSLARFPLHEHRCWLLHSSCVHVSVLESFATCLGLSSVGLSKALYWLVNDISLSDALQMMRKRRKGHQKMTMKWTRRQKHSRSSGAGATGKLARPAACAGLSSMRRPQTALSSAPVPSATCTCLAPCSKPALLWATPTPPQSRCRSHNHPYIFTRFFMCYVVGRFCGLAWFSSSCCLQVGFIKYWSSWFFLCGAGK